MCFDSPILWLSPSAIARGIKGRPGWRIRPLACLVGPQRNDRERAVVVSYALLDVKRDLRLPTPTFILRISRHVKERSRSEGGFQRVTINHSAWPHLGTITMSRKTFLVLEAWLLIGFGLTLSVGAKDTGLERPRLALTTLDSAGEIGQFTSVTIGADRLGLISY
jgi:hypothetical protein